MESLTLKEEGMLGNYMNGNIQDFKNELAKLSQKQLIEFVYKVQTNYREGFDSVDILDVLRRIL